MFVVLHVNLQAGCFLMFSFFLLFHHLYHIIRLFLFIRPFLFLLPTIPPYLFSLSHPAAAAVTMKRAELEQLIDEPYFDQFIRRALVRVNVNTAESGRVVYRLAEVVGVDAEPHSRTYVRSHNQCSCG